MNPLEQYLELYRSHRDEIDANGAPVLNALRDDAFRQLEGMTLPARGDENFENIDPGAMLAPDYGINLRKAPVEFDPGMTFQRHFRRRDRRL